MSSESLSLVPLPPLLHDTHVNNVLSSADLKLQSIEIECKSIEDKSKDAVNAIINRVKLLKSNNNVSSTSSFSSSSAVEAASAVLSATLLSIKQVQTTNKKEVDEKMDMDFLMDDDQSKTNVKVKGIFDLFEPPLSPPNVTLSSLDKLKKELAEILSRQSCLPLPTSLLPVPKNTRDKLDDVFVTKNEENIIKEVTECTTLQREKGVNEETYNDTDNDNNNDTDNDDTDNNDDDDDNVNKVTEDDDDEKTICVKTSDDVPSYSLKTTERTIQSTIKKDLQSSSSQSSSLSSLSFLSPSSSSTFSNSNSPKLKDSTINIISSTTTLPKLTTPELLKTKEIASPLLPSTTTSLPLLSPTSPPLASSPLSPPLTSSIIYHMSSIISNEIDDDNDIPHVNEIDDDNDITSVDKANKDKMTVNDLNQSFTNLRHLQVNSEDKNNKTIINMNQVVTKALQADDINQVVTKPEATTATTTTAAAATTATALLNTSLAVLKATLLLNDPERLKKALLDAEKCFEAAQHFFRSTSYHHFLASNIELDKPPESILRARKIVTGLDILTTALVDALTPPLSAIKLSQAVDVCNKAGLLNLDYSNKGEKGEIVKLFHQAIHMQSCLVSIRTDANLCIHHSDGFTARSIIQRLYTSEIGTLTAKEIALALYDVENVTNESSSHTATTWSAYVASELIRLSTLSDDEANISLLIAAYKAENVYGVASATFRIKHTAIMNRLIQFLKSKQIFQNCNTKNETMNELYNGLVQNNDSIALKKLIKEDEEVEEDEEGDEVLGLFGGNIYSSLSVCLPIPIKPDFVKVKDKKEEDEEEVMNTIISHEQQLCQEWDSPNLKQHSSSSSSTLFAQEAEKAIWGIGKVMRDDISTTCTITDTTTSTNNNSSSSSEMNSQTDIAISRSALKALCVALSTILYADNLQREGCLEALCKTIRVCRKRSELRNTIIILLLRKTGWGEDVSSIKKENTLDYTIRLRAIGILACCLYYFAPIPSSEHDIERAICAITIDTSDIQNISSTDYKKDKKDETLIQVSTIPLVSSVSQISSIPLVPPVPALVGGPKALIARKLISLLHVSLAKEAAKKNDFREEINPEVCANIAWDVARITFL
jgi:hypothetical protein